MSKQPRNAPIWIKVFVAFHLLAIIAWSLPPPPRAVMMGRVPPVGNEIILKVNEEKLKTFPPIRAYVATTGFWQYWDMFAPDPADADLWGDAEVVRQDGTVERFKYPRIYDLPIVSKYFHERYRKLFERVGSEPFAYAWPAFAQRVALLSDTDPNNRPKEVRLWRHRQSVARFLRPKVEDYDSYMYFRYVVDTAKLDEAKR